MVEIASSNKSRCSPWNKCFGGKYCRTVSGTSQRHGIGQCSSRASIGCQRPKKQNQIPPIF
eukprot:2419876-Amphidinium_carterae.1